MFSLVCSQDFGKSWKRRGQILTEGVKPRTPARVGIGGSDVVWDWQQSRWFLVASKMRGAVSYDKTATPDSWR